TSWDNDGGHNNAWTVSNGTYTIHLGSNDTLKTIGGSNTIYFNSDATNDTITLGNGTNVVNAGGSNGEFTVHGGTAGDWLEFFSMSGGDLTVTRPTGAAPDVVDIDNSSLNSVTLTISNQADALVSFGAHVTNLTLNVAVDGFKLPDDSAGSSFGSVKVHYVSTGELIAAPYNKAEPLPYFLSDLLFFPTPHWTTTLGVHATAPTLHFSMMQSVPSYATSGDANGFVALGGDLPAGYSPQKLLDMNTAGTITLSSAEVSAITALAAWAAVVNVRFVSAADSNSIDIRFGANTQSSGGYSYVPAVPVNYYGSSAYKEQADIYINKNYITDQHIFAHEIGHALGLGGESGNSDTSDVLPFGEDSGQYTVMSYNGAALGTPQVFDIALAQYLYGPNPNYHPNSSHVWTFNGSGGSGNLISDGGSSKNTISSVGTTADAYIDLRQGHWSWLGAKSNDVLAANQLFIDYGTVINIVKTGSGSTTVVCNDGNDHVTCGKGADLVVVGSGADVVSTGGGKDDVLCGTSDFAAADQFNGGGGTDTLTLAGNFAKPVTLDVTTLVSFENIVVDAGHNYDLVSNDATVASGATLTVTASALASTNWLKFDGHVETDGHFNLKGGAGNDTLIGGAQSDTISGGKGADSLTGGGGADHFVYASAAESTSTQYDTITDFYFGTDKFDLPSAASVTGIDKALTAGALSSASFNSDLAAALSGKLHAHHAILFTPNSGSLSGQHFLIVDVNGNAQYDPNTDFVFHLTSLHGTLSTGDFI
ncbi:MAG TPA: M10 family metallopeptidase C-terminal domain-containing protein, partial [Rhizomicrobium sp.]